MSVFSEVKMLAESRHIKPTKTKRKSDFMSLLHEDRDLMAKLDGYASAVRKARPSRLKAETDALLNGVWYRMLKEAEEDDTGLAEPDFSDDGPGIGFPEGTDDFDNDFDDTDTFDDGEEEPDDSPNHTSFQEEYPEADPETVTTEVYNQWLDTVKSKQFYKTILYYGEEYQRGELNFCSRDFLWRFLKAISSTVTHLFIEAEQKPEAIILVQTYFDSLQDCMDSVIYAQDGDDIETIFKYMMDFLGINLQPDSQEAEVSEEGFGSEY